MRFVILVSSLVLVAWGAASSPGLAAGKPVVGVADIKVVAQNVSCRGWQAAGGRDCNRYLAEGFRVMLETAIVRSNKMDVMERGRMDVVMGERLLGQAGVTDAGGDVGGVSGVDYLIYGSVTRFGVRQKGFGVSGGIGKVLSGATSGVLSSLSTMKRTTEMAVDVKVTDVATGRIVLADTVMGEAKQGEAFSVAGIQSTETVGDPFADVQRIVAARLSEKIVTARIPFKVIRVQADGTLILNYGSVFLSPGHRLALFEVGEQFVDPDTGEVLGSEEREVGLVEVVSSEAKFSRARVIDDGVAVSEGSVLKRVAAVGSERKSGTQRKRIGENF